MNISIDDIGVDFADSGPWRSYALEATGRTLKDLLDDACIFEIDQDDGTLSDYNLGDASSEVYDAAVEILKKEFNKSCSECGDPAMKRCDCRKCQDGYAKQEYYEKYGRKLKDHDAR